MQSQLLPLLSGLALLHAAEAAVVARPLTPVATPGRPAVPPLAANCAAAALLTATLLCGSPALAVSGGGKDYSGYNLEEADFSKKELKGKEFRGTIAPLSKWVGADLSSTSFFQADLAGADFSGANLAGASLEEAGLTGASFENAVLQSAYLTRTIAEAKTITGADFSDAVMPLKTQQALCKRPDATGTNPVTKAETRETLLCAD